MIDSSDSRNSSAVPEIAQRRLGQPKQGRIAGKEPGATQQPAGGKLLHPLFEQALDAAVSGHRFRQVSHQRGVGGHQCVVLAGKMVVERQAKFRASGDAVSRVVAGLGNFLTDRSHQALAVSLDLAPRCAIRGSRGLWP